VILSRLTGRCFLVDDPSEEIEPLSSDSSEAP
jgi:hypothetical protein